MTRHRRMLAAWFALPLTLWIATACLSAEEPLRPTEAYLLPFTRTVPQAARAKVPLELDFPTPLRAELVSPASPLRGQYPVTFGVPFPRGALASDKHVRLMETDGGSEGSAAGREVPAAIRCTATWDRPDGDVKWLLIDAAVWPGKHYALEYGTAISRVEVRSGLRVADDNQSITVTTGPLQLAVSRKRPGLLDAAWLDRNSDGTFADDELLIAPGTAQPPSMVDDGGTRYPLATDGYVVTVEQAGPLHAVIKIEGWYQAAEGTKLCQFAARLHAYAGQSFVRVEHAFVVAFDTDKTRIADIAIALPLRPGRNARACFGLDDSEVRSLTGRAYLLQDRPDHFTLTADGGAMMTGKRSAGWIDLCGGNGGLTVGLRRMWQECPRELEADGQTLAVHLWPAHGDRPLDFGARAVLGSDRYRAWDQVYHAGLYKGGLDQYDQAFGLAKSNDLLLAFHAPDAAPAAALCQTLDQPVIVAASPEWMCRSDVLGPLHPRDPHRFPDVERKLDAAFSRFELLREHAGLYGMIDYGDMLYYIQWNAERNAWEGKPWRRFASRFYGHPVMPWVQYLRSGQRRCLEYGIDNARHVMDIDMCHLTQEEVGDYRYYKRRGGRYGGNGGILHYAADLYDLGCDSHIDHLLLQYYLTGYRRAWDVLLEEADYYLWKDTQPGGHLHAWAHRMTGGALRTLTGLYQATWDPRYLELAHRMADFCYQNQDEQGVIRFDDVYMLPGMFAYYRATGDQRMRELILRCMRHQSTAGRNMSDPRSFGFYGLSLAYFLTGEPEFLPWAERWLRDFVSAVTESDDPCWHGKPKDQWDYCYLTLHLCYLPYYLEALTTLDRPVSFMNQDRAVTNGAVLLHREDGKPFHVAAEWFCYAPSHFTGPAVDRLEQYLVQRPTAARLVLRGPGGEEVAAAPVRIAADPVAMQGSKGTPAARRKPPRRSAVVELDVPAGPPGTYRLAIEDTGELHFKLRLAASDLRQWAYPTDDAYLACADAYYFYVPGDAEQFAVAFKTLALRSSVEFAVYDPSGTLRRKEEIKFDSTPPAKYTRWAFAAEPAQRGKLWKLTVSPAHPRVEQTYLKFEGLPPVIWTAAEAFFPLDKGLGARTSPKPAGPPYAGASPGRRIEPGKPLVLPRGPDLGSGRYQNVDPRQGTLEFWLRADWPADDIADHTFLAWGKLRLQRRSRLGTYLSLGGIRQSGFQLEPGHWYHLAVTWDAGADGRPPQTRFFINGVDLAANILSPSQTPLGDWTGPAMSIGCRAPLTIADLRISDTVRYREGFAPPTPIQRDEHTLVCEVCE